MRNKFLALTLAFLLTFGICAIEAFANEFDVSLDKAEIPFFLSIGETFEVPVLFPTSSELYSFKLEIEFDEDLLLAQDIIKPINPKGIEGYKNIDNEKGRITYWYSYNGQVSNAQAIAALKFKVLKKGKANIKILNSSEFYKKMQDDSLNPINVSFDDADITFTVGETTLAPPVFEKKGARFTNSITVRFEERTDGAQIYYSASGYAYNLNQKYDDTNGIYITKDTIIYAVARLYDENNNKIAESDIVSAEFTRIYSNNTGQGGLGGGKFVPPPPVETLPATNTPEQTTPSFPDIEGHWSKSFFEKLTQKGVISGYEDGTLKPDNQVTRAEVVKIIVSSLGLKPSEDLSLSFDDNDDIADWAKGYIKVAVEKGIITGYEDNTFKPGQSITRQELVVIAARAFNISGGGELSFDDGWKIAPWAKDSVLAAVGLGIVSGYDDNEFKPTRPVTRGEACKIISLCMEI
ncbi:MAG: S-layer homology domain-containing protein [Eubacteriales bacterium]|jgi:hypothetical protein|nr:S-layer homology domain-containing protein [Eubacteriales bacterium]